MRDARTVRAIAKRARMGRSFVVLTVETLRPRLRFRSTRDVQLRETSPPHPADQGDAGFGADALPQKEAGERPLRDGSSNEDHRAAQQQSNTEYVDGLQEAFAAGIERDQAHEAIRGLIDKVGLTLPRAC